LRPAIIGLDQLVAKVERRSDVALHEVRELLGVIGDRQLLGTQPLLPHLEIFVAGLADPIEVLGQHRPDFLYRYYLVCHGILPFV
jgi:hypothetical protein